MDAGKTEPPTGVSWNIEFNRRLNAVEEAYLVLTVEQERQQRMEGRETQDRRDERRARLEKMRLHHQATREALHEFVAMHPVRATWG